MFSTREENLVTRLAKMLRDMEPMEWDPIISQAKKRVCEEDDLPQVAKPQTARPFFAPGAALAFALANVQRGTGNGRPGNTP